MKRLVLTLAAAFTLLAMAAPAADAQIYLGPGYYGPRAFYGGGPYYRRTFYGPRRWYGPGYVGVYPGYRPYANSCFRWRLVPTAIGPQWRMINTCPGFVSPVYPYRYRAFYY